NLRLGSRLPAHATTLGRAILAHLTPEEINCRYAGATLTPMSEKTPTSLEELHKVLSEDRRSGLSYSSNHYFEGIGSIAAALFDRSNSVIAAVNVVGPNAMFQWSSPESTRIDDAVRRA